MIATWRKRSQTKTRLEQQAALAKRRAWVSKHLSEDPLFQVLSFDGLSWVCPYTGEMIPAPFSWQQEATAHLMNIEAWSQTTIMTLSHLHSLQWSTYLQEKIKDERHLRCFNKDGWWINPVTLKLSKRVQRTSTVINLPLVKQMAVELAELKATPKDLKTSREVRQAHPPAPRRPDQPVTQVHHMRGRRKQDTLGTSKWLKKIQDPPLGQAAVLSRPYEGVSGDLALVEAIPDGRTLIILADASGHGPKAAAISELASQLIARGAMAFKDLGTLLEYINDGLAEELRLGQFLTCFAAVYDPKTATLQSCCAGHHHALIANSADTAVTRRVGQHGMALGIRAGRVFSRTLRVESTTLEPGDTIFCYTDGLCEATSEKGVELGHWGAVSAFIGHIERSPQSIIKRILAQLRAYNGDKFDDDLTMMVFRYLGPDA